MNAHIRRELVIALVLIGLLILLANPTKLLMPTSTEMMLTVGLLIAFLVFTALIWKEQAADERDDRHRLYAGRLSFLIGSSVLTAGILVQSLHHEIDPWLVATLAGMVLAKTLARIYSALLQ